MGYKVAAPLTHQSPRGPGRGRKKAFRYIVRWVFSPGNYEETLRGNYTGELVAIWFGLSQLNPEFLPVEVFESADVENPYSHQRNRNLLTTISTGCIIFPLLVLVRTWLILSWISRTNVPQLDVKSHGSAVGEKYEAVPSLVFFCSNEGWQLLNGFIRAFLLQNLVLSFGWIVLHK